MASKDKSPRKLRREVLHRFEQGFDFVRLDYDRRVKPLRGKAIMIGVLLAAVVYLSGFSLGYYGWQQGRVAYEIFAKLVWLMMVPATAIGSFAWLIMTNRLEYTVREDIRCYIADREGGNGFMWRFGPMYEALLPDNIMAQRLLKESAENPVKMDPEDYARSLSLLRLTIQQAEHNDLSADVAARVYANFT